MPSQLVKSSIRGLGFQSFLLFFLFFVELPANKWLNYWNGLMWLHVWLLICNNVRKFRCGRFTTIIGCKFEALHLNLIACCLFPLLSTGLHVNYVLPAVLERQETSICWNSSQSDLGQQSRRPAVGSRHLLPQRQEVLRPRRHREKPHDSATPGRHRSIRTQVNCSVSSNRYSDRPWLHFHPYSGLYHEAEQENWTFVQFFSTFYILKVQFNISSHSYWFSYLIDNGVFWFILVHLNFSCKYVCGGETRHQFSSQAWQIWTCTTFLCTIDICNT